MPRPSDSFTFLGWLVVNVVALFVLVVGFVAVVDPYGVVALVDIANFNHEKTRRESGGGRVECSLRLWLDDYPMIILGSSRTAAAFDPRGPMLGGRGAYNASVAGTGMVELYQIGDFVLDWQRPERLLIGLDFLMFSDARSGEGDFELSGFSGSPMPFVYVRTLIGMNAIIDALRTIRDNLAGKSAMDRSDGFLDYRVQVGPEYDYRREFSEVLERNFLIDPETYGDYDYDPERLDLVEDLLRRVVTRGIQVDLFIPPVHARHLEATRALGLWPVYERWLSDLTTVVARLERDAAKPRIRLWDFSGYNSVTTEDVPDEGRLDDDMVWYWESSHFTTATGELMLARALDPKGVGPQVPADFGVLLRLTNLAEELARKRTQREAYARNFPDEIKDIASSVNRTAKIRDRLRDMEGSSDVQQNTNPVVSSAVVPTRLLSTKVHVPAASWKRSVR